MISLNFPSSKLFSNIILYDDNPIYRRFFLKLFQARSQQPIIAEDFETVMQHLDEDKNLLLITNSLILIKQIRRLDAYETVSIVYHDLILESKTAYAAGANAVLPKPFSPQQLLDCFNNL